ncbi:MAG: hypothetical protein FJZ00_04725 [Candidatus Sericytochromatia bacterium]|uniref:Restriction endonuclease n=1 Tax=Candidatus Tanganyikabacteria bacterium TaxID=2961651 RepID=A0A938BKP5_9BACT|nr:hypothetical protein [Candidatus Tanganyikabacteria bacterium]
MGKLSKVQMTLWEKARALGSGNMGVALTDEACAYLVGRVALDLGLGSQFKEVPANLPEFFSKCHPQDLVVKGIDPIALFYRLVSAQQDADTFFACLAQLHKLRLKYAGILERQPLPTLEQVGPRGLLQFGHLSPRALAGLLFWRKWFFDIDNRAGQETGYLFEPVIAYAVGGTPAPAKKSPIKRSKDSQKGRQVDCILGKRAYEFKIRVTIAASGQGRWAEELAFPVDCKHSGYTPVLVCLDATSNQKLTELAAAFAREGGEVYLGAQAWQHLDGLAGKTMAKFLEGYVRGPLNALIEEAPAELPDFSASLSGGVLTITVGGEVLKIDRSTPFETDNGDVMPDDVTD